MVIKFYVKSVKHHTKHTHTSLDMAKTKKKRARRKKKLFVTAVVVFVANAATTKYVALIDIFFFFISFKWQIQNHLLFLLRCRFGSFSKRHCQIFALSPLFLFCQCTMAIIQKRVREKIELNK